MTRGRRIIQWTVFLLLAVVLAGFWDGCSAQNGNDVPPAAAEVIEQ